MTTVEFSNEFDIHYNAIASQSNPGLDVYEKSVFLTKAQLEIVKNYYTPEGNKYKKGFENTQKRRVDLEELVKTDNSTVKIVTTSNISNNSQFFKIPDDVFLMVYESAKIKTNDCFNNTYLNVIPKTHDEFNIQEKNPFKQPDKSVVWRMNVSKIGNFKVVELLNPFEIIEYKIRYIKYPKPIILKNLNDEFPGENLTIDGFFNEQTSELHPEIHREILDRAVELALRDYKPQNLESKVQLDSRNE